MGLRLGVAIYLFAGGVGRMVNEECFEHRLGKIFLMTKTHRKLKMQKRRTVKKKQRKVRK